jgi:hypothetical protein
VSTGTIEEDVDDDEKKKGSLDEVDEEKEGLNLLGKI